MGEQPVFPLDLDIESSMNSSITAFMPPAILERTSAGLESSFIVTFCSRNTTEK
ncbi:hypothetical protein [Methanolobus sp.]|uniref:hypothetical protein n=1 Tax=Methanolobus sp. TaxID=1874737 RepID=UPI0025F122CF|nr:hypothetical protein [Methanolobus sp.]